MSFDIWTKRLRLASNERLVTSAGLCALVLFGVYDFIEDYSEGAAAVALWNDFSDLLISVLLLAYIWFNQPLKARKTVRVLERQNARRSADLAHWRKIGTQYLQGLGGVIDAQFDQWSLTGAEKEVGLLLLKGLSMREIAEVRGISERTARQQAGAIYTKSALGGRAELSAFFLEDLLLPSSRADRPGAGQARSSG